MEALQTDHKWLVKSNSTVTGPFRFDDVVEAIFKGDIHVLDEIKGPFERWRPIRDHSLFNAAIEKLKASTYARREYTVTDNVDYSTQDITQTHAENPLLSDTQTAVETTESGIDNFTPTAEASGHSRAISIDGSSPMDEQSSPEQPKVYAHPPQQKSKFPFLSILAMGFIGAGIIGFFLLQGRSAKKVNAPTKDVAYEFTDLGERALREGDFKKALENFRKASELKPTDPDIALYRAPLEIHYGTGIKANMDYVEQIIAGNTQANISQGKNIVGLGHATMGQHQAAVKQYDIALEKDDSYFPAWVNKGYSLMALGQPNKAIGVLNEALQLSAKDGYYARYLLVRAYIEQGMRSQKEDAFQEAIEHANYFTGKLKAFDLRQEVMFFKAVALQNTGVTKEELTTFVRSFLSIDPELTNLHSHDVNWDYQSFSWKELAPLCNSLSNSLGATTGELLAGFCAFKRGETLNAKNKFERQLRQNPKDGLLRGLITVTLAARGDSDAQAALAFHDKISGKHLFADVVMRECLKANDIDCADKVQVMMENKVNVLYQNWYQAEKFKKSQKSLAIKALGNGLDISYQFVPFLRLKRDL